MNQRFGRKLVLRKETIRMLTDREASMVVGGNEGSTALCGSSIGCCSTCTPDCGTALGSSAVCGTVGSCSH
jgi:hypothetical protein